MAKLTVKKGSTSKLLDIFIQDSSKTDGSGLTGLVYNTAGLTAYYYREGAATAVAITLATMTLGTWATGGFVGTDGTNMPGCYQLGIPDAALATGASSVIVLLKGATNMAPLVLEIQLTAFDYDTAIAQTGDAYARLGAPAGASVSADVAAVKTDTGNIYTDTHTNGVVIPQAQADKVWGTTTRLLTAGTNIVLAKGTGITGFNDIAVSNIWQDTTAGDFTVASSIGKSLYTGNVAPGSAGGLFIAGTNAGTTVNFTGNLSGSVGSVTGTVTVGTNNDKTGYTVSTVSDKTGYSLSSLESAILQSGTAQAGAASNITLAAGASATTDLYKGLRVRIYGGTGAGQSRMITGYNGTSKVATVDWNWTTAPDATSTYAVIDADGPSVNSSLQVSTTASDPWSTALPGSYGAGTAGYIIGTNLNATITSRLASGNVTVGTNLDKTGYALTQTFPTNFSAMAITAGGAVTAGTVSDKIGYSISGTKTTLDALNDFNPTATLTESYAANATAFTTAQALYMIWSALTEFAISGTTVTCKKLDHTTTAATYTLDSSTAPTSRTRAT